MKNNLSYIIQKIQAAFGFSWKHTVHTCPQRRTRGAGWTGEARRGAPSGGCPPAWLSGWRSLASARGRLRAAAAKAASPPGWRRARRRRSRSDLLAGTSCRRGSSQGCCFLGHEVHAPLPYIPQLSRPRPPTTDTTTTSILAISKPWSHSCFPRVEPPGQECPAAHPGAKRSSRSYPVWVCVRELVFRPQSFFFWNVNPAEM